MRQVKKRCSARTPHAKAKALATVFSSPLNTLSEPPDNKCKSTKLFGSPAGKETTLHAACSRRAQKKLCSASHARGRWRIKMQRLDGVILQRFSTVSLLTITARQCVSTAFLETYFGFVDELPLEFRPLSELTNISWSHVGRR